MGFIEIQATTENFSSMSMFDTRVAVIS